MYVSIRRKDKDMENFSRMTMLIPFSEYQKKIEAKAGSGDSQILKGGGAKVCHRRNISRFILPSHVYLNSATL